MPVTDQRRVRARLEGLLLARAIPAPVVGVLAYRLRAPGVLASVRWGEGVARLVGEPDVLSFSLIGLDADSKRPARHEWGVALLVGPRGFDGSYGSGRRPGRAGGEDGIARLVAEHTGQELWLVGSRDAISLDIAGARLQLEHPTALRPATRRVVWDR